MEKEKSCITYRQFIDKFKEIYSIINKKRSEKLITGVLIAFLLVIICVYLKYKTNNSSFIICAILSIVTAIIFVYIYRPRNFKEPESCKECKSTCINDPKYEGIYEGISITKNILDS
jgi:DNA integrity scanning protein DisA with diadenylate cyclase activity